MKNLLYLAFALLMLLLAACSSKDKDAADAAVDPHFDVAFATTYNDANVARADSAFDVVDSLSATNQAYLALFYNNASDNSFENSQRYMERAVVAYNAAVAKNQAEADQVFELVGKEYRLSAAEINGQFAQRARMLKGEELPDSYTIVEEEETAVADSVAPAAEVPEQTIEEAIEAVQ